MRGAMSVTGQTHDIEIAVRVQVDGQDGGGLVSGQAQLGAGIQKPAVAPTQLEPVGAACIADEKVRDAIPIHIRDLQGAAVGPVDGQ